MFCSPPEICYVRHLSMNSSVVAGNLRECVRILVCYTGGSGGSPFNYRAIPFERLRRGGKVRYSEILVVVQSLIRDGGDTNLQPPLTRCSYHITIRVFEQSSPQLF